MDDLDRDSVIHIAPEDHLSEESFCPNDRTNVIPKIEITEEEEV